MSLFFTCLLPVVASYSRTQKGVLALKRSPDGERTAPIYFCRSRNNFVAFCCGIKKAVAASRNIPLSRVADCSVFRQYVALPQRCNALLKR